MKSVHNPKRIGYVVKRYPRYSETFIVNEIISHEKAGLNIVIFSLLPTVDTHFQDIIGHVKSPLVYLRSDQIKGFDLWTALLNARKFIPDIFSKLELVIGEEGKDDIQNIYQGLQLATLVCRYGIDHLHAHFGTSATTVARIASIFSGVTYTFTAHARDIYHNDVDNNKLKEKIIDSSQVITIGNYNLKYLHRLYPEQRHKITLIYNGLNLECFPNSNNQDIKIENKIISVGRLIEKKGFHILIDACSILEKKKIPFQCQIIGTGTLKDQLQSQINNHGLKEKILLTGALPRNKMFELIQESTVFVAPSVLGSDGDRDGLPTTLLEAMALGTPCISTKVTGIPEIVQDKVTGILVEEKDPVSLADAIERILVDPALRMKFSKKARSLIQLNFDLSKNSEQIRQVFYSSILEKTVIKEGEDLSRK